LVSGGRNQGLGQKSKSRKKALGHGGEKSHSEFCKSRNTVDPQKGTLSGRTPEEGERALNARKKIVSGGRKKKKRNGTP